MRLTMKMHHANVLFSKDASHNEHCIVTSRRHSSWNPLCWHLSRNSLFLLWVWSWRPWFVNASGVITSFVCCHSKPGNPDLLRTQGRTSCLRFEYGLRKQNLFTALALPFCPASILLEAKMFGDIFSKFCSASTFKNHGFSYKLQFFCMI